MIYNNLYILNEREEGIKWFLMSVGRYTVRSISGPIYTANLKFELS
jgi:hypothetical protein